MKFAASILGAALCLVMAVNYAAMPPGSTEPEYTPVITYQGTNEAVIGGEVFYPGDDRTITVQGRKIRVKFIDGILWFHFKR